MLGIDTTDDGTAQAKVYFAQAEQLFSLGQFADALALYAAAFRTKPYPEFLFNMAQCHRNLGNNAEAVTLFERYLALKPDATNRTAVLDLIAKLAPTVYHAFWDRDQVISKAQYDAYMNTAAAPARSPWALVVLAGAGLLAGVGLPLLLTRRGDHAPGPF